MADVLLQSQIVKTTISTFILKESLAIQFSRKKPEDPTDCNWSRKKEALNLNIYYFKPS